MPPPHKLTELIALLRPLTKRVNVLQLRSSPFVGSPEKMILGRIKHMDQAFLKYHVGVFNEQVQCENEFMNELNRLKACAFELNPSILRFYRTIRSLMKLIKAQEIDLICANDYKSSFFAYLLKKIMRIPIISVFHGRTGKDLKVQFYEKIDSVLLRYFNAVITVCDNGRQKLNKNGVKPKNIYVIPNAVDLNRLYKDELAKSSIRTEFALSATDKLVVFVGRLSKEKGLTILLQAVHEIIRDLEHVKFLLVGDGSERKIIERLTRRYGLDNSILLTGFRKDVHRFLEAMDFLILPSLTEGMPVVILEAFAAGKPVVATSVGGTPELVTHGVNGFLVERRSVESLKDAMTRLIGDDEMRIRMGRNALRMVSNQYTFPIQIEGYISVYRSVLDGFRKPQMSSASTETFCH